MHLPLILPIISVLFTVLSCIDSRSTSVWLTFPVRELHRVDKFLYDALMCTTSFAASIKSMSLRSCCHHYGGGNSQNCHKQNVEITHYFRGSAYKMVIKW